MKSFTAIAGICLLGIADAVNVTKYSAGDGVEAGFMTYLNEFYASAEDPAATTAFTDFFTTDGELIVLNSSAKGAQELLTLMHNLLPTAGNKHQNYFPNVTTVEAETRAEKTYKVLGVIETTYDGGNCSAAYYSSRLTVSKDAKGTVQLEAHGGNLVAYDVFDVDPSTSPTSIKCGLSRQVEA